jgi:hypothetical protein
LKTCLNSFDDLCSHSQSFPLPSLCAFPGCLFPNDPQDLPMRSIRIPSRALYRQPRHLYPDLSTVMASITLHAPPRSVVVAFIGLVMQKAVSMSSSGSSRSGEGAADRNAPPLYYTVLSVETPDPFGFDSAAPARPPIRPSDTPGPGKCEPRPGNFHIESVPGHGLGFTSLVPRKPEYFSRHRNPAPCTCDPARVDRRIRPRIGLNPLNRRCICYPNEGDSSLMPGAGSYSLRLPPNGVTSVFKSRSERNSFPGRPRQPPRFDGRTFLLPRSDSQGPG